MIRAVPFILVLLVASSPAVEAQDPEIVQQGLELLRNRNAPTFIRYRDGSLEARLETAVKTYESLDTGMRVTLIGLVQVGDDAYFEAMAKEVSRHTVVLHEFVPRPDAENADQAATTWGTQIQLALRDYLGLSHQSTRLSPGEGWHAADMSRSDVDAALTARGVELVPYANVVDAFGPLASLSLEALKRTMGKGESPLLAKLRDRFKRTAAAVIGRGSSIYDRLKGQDERKRDEVIVTMRNERVMEALSALAATGDAGDVALVYGTAYMPDLERRLIDAWELAPVKVEWHAAWRMIDAGARPKQPKKSRRDL